MPRTETRRTDWIPCGELTRIGVQNFTHYRIWQRYAAGVMFQRCEWKSKNGTQCFDAWTRGVKAWLSQAAPFKQQEN